MNHLLAMIEYVNKFLFISTLLLAHAHISLHVAKQQHWQQKSQKRTINVNINSCIQGHTETADSHKLNIFLSTALF